MANPVVYALILFLGVVLTGGCAAAVQSSSSPPWKKTCSSEADQRVCSLSLRQHYQNNRGGRDPVTLILRRGHGCTSLHLRFDREIDIDRPVTIAVDERPPLPFYTTDQLNRLARDIDNLREPEWGPPEFLDFYDEVAAGSLSPSTTPGSEMVARFALIKRPQRIGMACAATTRFLPTLTGGRTLRVRFQIKPRSEVMKAYHWPRMTVRAVNIPLDGLAEALNALAPDR